MKIEELLSEKALAQSLKVSRATMLKYRHQGLPWISLGGKAFYLESEFMDWIVAKQKRTADEGSGDTTEDKEL